MKDDSQKKKILIDADVTIHFHQGNKLELISQIFPKRIVYNEKVIEELYIHPEYKVEMFNFISKGSFERIDVDDNLDYVQEYAKIIKFAGKGEAACMAIAKVNNEYIASSNLKDIKEYCDENGIRIITTMDFLWEAFQTRLLTEDECDNFIKDVLAAGSKLPVKSFEEYVKKYVMKNK